MGTRGGCQTGILLALVVVAIGALRADAVPIPFPEGSDGTFDPADWELVVVQGGDGGDVQVAQVDDPDPARGKARTVRHVLNPSTGPSSIIGFHMKIDAVYDPAVHGPLGWIEYSERSLLIEGANQGQATGLAIRQPPGAGGDLFYYASSDRLFTPFHAWTQQFSHLVVATDFGLTQGTASTPDFSQPFQLGFYRASSNPTAFGGGTNLTAIDDWSVTLFPPCTDSAECDDGDQCTTDACESGACTATDTPDCGLTLTKDDNGHRLTDGPVISFEVAVTNVDPVTKTGVRLVEVVPIQTTFQPNASTAGWACPDGPEEGKLCTFDVGNLGVGETRTAAFTVQVGAAPTSWGIYNEVGVVVGAAPVADGLVVASRVPRGIKNPLAYGGCRLAGITTTSCAWECSEALHDACWTAYEQYIVGAPGVTRQSLALVCCMANLVVRSECSLEDYDCGDDVKQALEDCDDGNVVDGDGCDNNCKATGCGNFVPTAGEACDDGPSGTPCCTAGCTLPPSPPATCFPAAPAAVLAGAPVARGAAAPPPNPIDLRLLYALRDGVFRATVGGRRAVELYYRHSPDLVGAALAAPQLLDLARTALAAWEPALAALATGVNASVSTTQVAALNDFLDALEPVASPVLQRAIARGRKRLQVDAWPGLAISAALARLEGFVCTAGASFQSVTCRIDDLVEVLEDVPDGPTPQRLLKLLRAADAKVALAQTVKTGPARRALKTAGGRLKAFEKKARSKRGQRDLPPTARDQIVTLTAPLRADVKSLRSLLGR